MNTEVSEQNTQAVIKTKHILAEDCDGTTNAITEDADFLDFKEVSPINVSHTN